MNTLRTFFLPALTASRRLRVCLNTVFLGALCLVSHAADQSGVDDRLLGDWIGTSEDFKGARATITRDSITLSGERMPLRFVSPGVLMMGPTGDAERARYQLSGETLTVLSDGERSTWRRVGKPPVKSVEPIKKTKAPENLTESDIGKNRTEKAKPSSGPVVFKEHKLTDPGMNNIVATTFLVPEDWTAKGELRRMPPAVYSIPVVADIKFTAPDGRQVHFLPSLIFDFDNSQPGQVMQPTMKGNLYMPLPQSAGSWLMEMVELSPDPEITNVKLISEEDVPEVTQLLRQQNQQLIQQIEQGNQIGAQTGLISRYDTQATKVVITYEQDGRTYEESLLIMWNYMVSAFQGQVTSGLWSIPAMFSVRGTPGTDYINDPEMIAILGSVRINPAWQTEMNKYWAQLAQIRHKGNMDRLNASAAAHQKRMNTLNETSDILMSGWKSRNASQDRMQAKTINSIHEQTPYSTPSGETVKLPSYYNNVYTDGNGRYILNNDSLYEPNTDPAVNTHNWQRIEANE